MKIKISFLLCSQVFLFFSCTFNYTITTPEDDEIPEIRIIGAQVQRYEDSTLSYALKADNIDIYKNGDVWIAKNIDFLKYKLGTNDTLELEGQSGIIFVDEINETYFLGQNNIITIHEENITIHSTDLRFTKSNNILSSPKNKTVLLEKTDGTTLLGKGFSANLLSYQYHFEGPVSGSLVKEINSTVKVENNE